MRYIKINKPSLDYNQFSDFHAFTMNNLVRNVMRNGKYKKAVKLVRLGLLFGIKELYNMLRKTDERVARTFYPLPRTYLTEETKENLIFQLTETRIQEEIKKEAAIDSQFQAAEQDLLNSYQNFEEVKEFYTHICDSYFTNFKHNLSQAEFDQLKPPIYKKIQNQFDEERNDLVNHFAKLKQVANEKKEEAYLNQRNNHIVKDQFNKYTFQYHRLDQLKFIKLYTKKQHTYYYGIRDLTVFDMVLQVYTMLTGAWYMRKAKVSGRTILIPSPLRPYRRIVTVTKMLLKGIEKRRHIQRAKKNAMVNAFGTEFCWLLFYNGFQYTPTQNFDNSDVWAQKMASHKELVANLKNIKYLKYF